MVERILIKLDRALFISILKECEENIRRLKALCDLLPVGVYFFILDLIDRKVLLLNRLLELEARKGYGTEIDHYVYASDFGRKKMKIYNRKGDFKYRIIDEFKLWERLIAKKSERKL